jgi:hypothetical protein
MQRSSSESVAVFLRLLGRYAIATIMIPVGVLLGVGGLIQFGLRRLRHRHAPAGPSGPSGPP